MHNELLKEIEIGGEISLCEVIFTDENGLIAVDSFAMFTEEGCEIEMVPAPEFIENGYWSPAFRIAIAEQIF